MQKYLPKIIAVVAFITIINFVIPSTFAQNVGQGSSEGWVVDKDVTFAGKVAARSNDLLNWVISNYKWASIDPAKVNPFNAIWISIRNITYILLAFFILAGAVLMIVTRGRSITVRRFIPRFILTAVLIFFSFSIVNTLYFFTDIIQGFFFRIEGRFINSGDLLNVAFDYKDFVGYRLPDTSNDESVFMSLLMVKLTAITYYAMFIILIVRKVILWFFIVVSPIFPLLLLFSPLRNSAKIWVGEFFRWLLYAPLFAILLSGLVALWKIYIPLDLTHNGEAKYPTAISILLGGPKQSVSLENSLNSTDTFIQYVVALLMLWMVMIIPFLLLKIFLDYFHNYSLTESNIVKYLAQTSSPILSKYGLTRGPTPGTGPQPSNGSTGLAKSLPIFTHSAINELQRNMEETNARNQSMIDTSLQSTFSQNLAGNVNVGSINVPEVNADLLNLSNLSLPSMRDISRYEGALLSGRGYGKDEANKIYEALNRLSGKSPITTPAERERFTAIREKIVKESQSGNSVANSILAASMAGGDTPLPEKNSVQQVNLDDYEEVKNIWQENYRKIDPPAGPDGNPRDRKSWLKEEVKKIPEVIDLLLSPDPQKQKEGKERVSKILPFLLLGGFSKEEIVAYLKAKLEAAKVVLNELLQVEGQAEEVEVTKTKQEKPKVMQVEEKM